MFEVTFLDYFWMFGMIVLLLVILGLFFIFLGLIKSEEPFIAEALMIIDVSTLVSKLVA
jgi:hypothetical protein